ncbi:MAG: response regulator [Deltaproteobacteria bacterium]|nr:response regulator [Deltaproteobacteria bacterium]
MENKEIGSQSTGSLLNQIKVLKDQVKKLTAGELHQYDLQLKLDSQLKTQEEIIKLGQKIQTLHSEKEIAELVTHALVESFEYEKALMLLLDESSGGLSLTGMDGYYEGQEYEHIESYFGDLAGMFENNGISGTIVQQELPVSVMGMDSRVLILCRVGQGDILGAIVFGNSRENISYHRAIEQEDFTLFETIQRITSTALENVLLYRQLNLEREGLRRARDNLRNLNDELEQIVQERTSELAESREEYRMLYLESERTSRKYRTLLDFTADPIVVYDNRGLPIYVNPAFVRVFGWESDDVQGRSIDFIPPGGEKDAESLDDLVARGDKISNYETKRLTKDGREMDVSISAAAHFDEKGAYAGSIYHLRDITEMKRIEGNLIRIQKLESIGLLAGGIAHDFNNILSGILMNTQMAQLKADRGDDISGSLKGIEKSTERAVKLTQQLLTFAKGGSPVKKIASIDKFTREVIEFVLHGSNLKCEFDVGDNLWAVEIDDGQMNQVIYNLIINAQQTMPDGGTIRIGMENVTLDEMPEGNKTQKAREDKFVRISIQDTGEGIPEKNLCKIFDPYFSTKDTGTGLGLATTYSIISKHNGYITVDSKVGVGSTFTIYLPASTKTLPHSDYKEEQGCPHEGKGSVLVMDDEEIIRDLLCEMIVGMGYRAEKAGHGHEALEMHMKAKHEGQPYDIVIMDLTIPGGMGGRETIAEIRKTDPDIRAIVSSGYSNDPIMADYKKYGFDGVLKKPFKIEDLQNMLNEISGITDSSK